MKLGLALLLAAAPLSARASGQTAYDFALGANDGLRSVSAGASRRHAVLSSGRLLLGYGARATLLAGRLELYPVRAGAASDRLTVDDARLLMLNAGIHAAVRIAEPLEAGFNLDLAGVTAGSSASASYRSSPGAADARVGASPTRGNLFLFGSNDVGSLNSEFYAAWRASPAISVRAGLSHALSEYRADLPGGTRLYRQFSNLVFIGVRWSPGT